MISLATLNTIHVQTPQFTNKYAGMISSWATIKQCEPAGTQYNVIQVCLAVKRATPVAPLVIVITFLCYRPQLQL
jgi:hypothetical protein